MNWQVQFLLCLAIDSSDEVSGHQMDDLTAPLSEPQLNHQAHMAGYESFLLGGAGPATYSPQKSLHSFKCAVDLCQSAVNAVSFAAKRSDAFVSRLVWRLCLVTCTRSLKYKARAEFCRFTGSENVCVSKVSRQTATSITEDNSTRL